MAQGEYFIDCHCHLFNVDDIPLYATLTASLPSRGLLALGSLLGAVDKELKRRAPMVQFFEKSRWQNLAELSTTVATVREKAKKTKTILTPLIMDFDKLPNSHECCQEQTEALLAAIRGKAPAYAQDKGLRVDAATSVFPFFGIDLSRFDQGAASKTLQALTAFFGGIKRGSGPEALANGDIIGVKLYPTIDRGPCPSDRLWGQRREFLGLCEAQKTPITAHCQAGSYKGYRMRKQDILACAGPHNWQKVLGSYGDLRLNLAHFGGDQSVKSLMRWRLLHPEMKTRYQQEWVWGVIDLLKRYPNTCADVSAYAFDDAAAVTAFQQLLVLDELGAWDAAIAFQGPRHKLKDKLLWGSDVPLVPTPYEQMFKQLTDALDLKKCLPIVEGAPGKPGATLAPRGTALPARGTLLDLFVNANPYNFLFA